MITVASLTGDSNALAPHYSRFRVADRLLLTGHSHQAWPDRAERGQQLAFDDAAELVDGKWDRAFAKADRVRRGFARLLDDRGGFYTLSANTHDLVVRFLSALPLEARRRLVTTDGEFHTLSRQLRRLAEEGVEVLRVPALPASTVGERLAAVVDDRTAAVLTSSVFFESAEIADGLGDLLEVCRRVGASFLVDTYHQLGVVPMSLEDDRLEAAFVVGGGYKYLQLGEGNCFLRFPKGCRLRPAITGWFAAFEALEDPDDSGPVPYSDDGWRFAGATHEPTSHYRAAEVFDFFDEMGLSPELLREVSQHQIGLLSRLFDELDLDPGLIRRDRSVPLERLGGFLALAAPRAPEIQRRLRERGVLSDQRRGVLRLGPAPYLADSQLADAVGILGEVVRGLETA